MDFLLYNRVGKKPILAIEVDGYTFHKSGTKQSHRDTMKDEINSFFQSLGVRVGLNIRF